MKELNGRWSYMADKAGISERYNKEDSITEFQIVGKFIGNWKEEVEYLLERYNGGYGFNFLNKLSKVRDIKPYTYDLDKEDMESLGISKDSEFVSKIRPSELERERANCPAIWNMIDWFGFTGEVMPKIHIQLPGQVFPFHFDDLTTLKGNEENADLDGNYKRYARIEVQLYDWDYGHMWGVGNSYWERWEAGEIMFHDWKNIPHGTANAGLTPRICLQISGEVTDELYKKLRKNNGEINV